MLPLTVPFSVFSKSSQGWVWNLVCFFVSSINPIQCVAHNEHSVKIYWLDFENVRVSRNSSPGPQPMLGKRKELSFPPDLCCGTKPALSPHCQLFPRHHEFYNATPFSKLSLNPTDHRIRPKVTTLLKPATMLLLPNLFYTDFPA